MKRIEPPQPRILFCSHLPVTKTLGASKVLAEVAEAMDRCGWDCTLIGPESVRSYAADLGHPFGWYGPALRGFLRERSAEYDVIDYDHVDLPYPRSEFSASTLMVARSVLLSHHLLKIRIPHGPTLRQRVGHVVRGPLERRQHKCWTKAAQRTIENADLVNVANGHDRRELHAWGIPDRKIAVLPYGVGADRRVRFDAISETPPAAPKVCFVGTFDYRKGAREMPDLFAQIAAAVPAVSFELLGTAAMFQTVEQVLAHFPRRLRPRIRVIPRFRPDDLPDLIKDCSVGIFPSWLEGFGIGVLEMMAAAIPVIAYDVPGPPEMVRPDQLVRAGDTRTMASKVIWLLTHPRDLAVARRQARSDSRRFDWTEIGKATGAVYLDHLTLLRRNYDRPHAHCMIKS